MKITIWLKQCKDFGWFLVFGAWYFYQAFIWQGVNIQKNVSESLVKEPSTKYVEENIRITKNWL